MEFSIEYSTERIYDKRTKTIFNEVVSSYINQNYRSAIVMLYTAVVCDLIYKMQDLRDIYQDAKAGNILNDIEKDQAQTPTSPKWEEVLIKRIGEETELLSHIEIDGIYRVKKIRNISAHPVLNEVDILYVPTKELTIACIREMVEAVLIKPPLLSKKIMESFLEDVASSKIDFINSNDTCDIKTFGVFLGTRYFRFMGDTLKKQLFKGLWKFVFQISNSDCDENRIINFYALECLYKNSREILKDYIKSDSRLFSISDDYIVIAYEFLLKYNEVYPLLSEDVQIKLRKAYQRHDPNIKILGVFMDESLEAHCSMLVNYFREGSPVVKDVPRSLDLLYEYASDNCKNFKVLSCYIEIFSFASSYKDAEDKLRAFILPYLRYMEASELQDLADAIRNNRQIYECYYVGTYMPFINNFFKNFYGEDYSLETEINDSLT